MRADLEDAVEVEPDREVIALGAFCLGMTVDFCILLGRQSFLVEADLADAAGQMREVLRPANLGDDVTDVGIADKDRLVVPLTNLAVIRDARHMCQRLAIAIRIAARLLVKGHRVLRPFADLCLAALPRILCDIMADAPLEAAGALYDHAQAVRRAPANGLAADHQRVVAHLAWPCQAVDVRPDHAGKALRRAKVAARRDLDVIAVLLECDFHVAVDFTNLRRAVQQCCMAMPRLVEDARDDADAALD